VVLVVAATATMQIVSDYTLDQIFRCWMYTILCQLTYFFFFVFMFARAEAADVFNQFFSGGFGFSGSSGNHSRKRMRTPDVQHQIGLTLEEFYKGCTKKLNVQRQVMCKTSNTQDTQILVDVNRKQL
jgi:hypothetical protein